MVLYFENSPNFFRPEAGRRLSPNFGGQRPQSSKTAKEPFKNIGSNHILVKENFFIFVVVICYATLKF